MIWLFGKLSYPFLATGKLLIFIPFSNEIPLFAGYSM